MQLFPRLSDDVPLSTMYMRVCVCCAKVVIQHENSIVTCMVGWLPYSKQYPDWKSGFLIFLIIFLVMQKFELKEGEILALKSHQLNWRPLL